MSGQSVLRFSPKQKRVLTWWSGRGGAYDAIICDGAVRSGKTLSMGISFFCWAMVEKFFHTTDSAVLFPEFVSRVVRQGMTNWQCI